GAASGSRCPAPMRLRSVTSFGLTSPWKSPPKGIWPTSYRTFYPGSEQARAWPSTSCSARCSYCLATAHPMVFNGMTWPVCCSGISVLADETTLLACVRSALVIGQDMDATSIAEALWLAAYTLPAAAPPTATEDSTSDTPRPASNPPLDRPDPSAQVPRTGDADPGIPNKNAGTPATAPSLIPGRRFQVRHVRPGSEQLDMLRSLRPFKRRWTQGRRHELDIHGTVEAYARTWKLVQQFRAAPERWFEADIVIDDSPSMAGCASATSRLVKMLEQLGAFRTVRTWWISATGATPELFNKGRRSSGTGQLRSPDG